MEDKITRLKSELEKYQTKLAEMQKNWAATKSGSRYGDEYLETQIKVYESFIFETKVEIAKLKRLK